MAPAGAEVRESEAHPVLAAGEVRYVGQPVALVIARSRALAEDAAELVEVEYDPRPVITSPRASDLTLMRWSRRAGDVEAAFAGAAHVARGSYALPRLVAAPMEARGCIAAYDPGADLLTVWCSAQDTHRPLEPAGPHPSPAAARHEGDRPRRRRRVWEQGSDRPRGGRGDGRGAALRIPVKWAEDRLENLSQPLRAAGSRATWSWRWTPSGRMLALRARLWSDLGGYLLTTTPLPPHTAATLITGCYDIPAADVTVIGARTHKPPTGPYRGAGRPDAAYMLEALVDQAARQTGMDRVALRRRNLDPPVPPHHADRAGVRLGRLRALPGPGAGAGRRRAGSGGGLGPGQAADDDTASVGGTGIAVYVERAGGAFESAEVELLPGGRFAIASSSSPHGQGHDITFAQIAADRLHASVSAIELRFGDSATTPPGVGTFGSRSVAMAGSAVAVAVTGWWS